MLGALSEGLAGAADVAAPRSRGDVAQLSCQLAYMNTLLEVLVGRPSAALLPFDPLTEPFVAEGSLTATGETRAYDLELSALGKVATKSTVYNTGDNPFLARFELAKRGFVNLTVQPREVFNVPFVFRTVQLIGTRAGPSTYRVICQ